MANLLVLDELCIDHLAAEEDRQASVAEATRALADFGQSAHDAVARASCFEGPETAILFVHGLACEARFEQALAVADTIAPGALDDPHFQMELKLHHLTELVYEASSFQNTKPADPTTRSFAQSPERGVDSSTRQTLPDYSKALDYARTTLAPYAQEAYPEAYNHFLEHMLIFSFPERASNAIMQRCLLADTIASTLYAHHGVRDSRLSLMLRYLVAIHLDKGALYASTKNVAQSGATISKIFPNGTQPSLSDTGPSTSFGEGNRDSAQKGLWDSKSRPVRHCSTSRDFREADILTLRDRLPMSRDEAVETLRYAKGNVWSALRFELSRIRVNWSVLNKLVRLFCLARGIVPPAIDQIPEEPDVNQVLLQLRSLVQSGSASKLGEAASSLCPTLFASSPALHFKVQRAALVERLKDGNFEGALTIARTQLGPLSSESPDLFSALRETMVLLAYPVADNDSSNLSAGDHELNGKLTEKDLGSEPVTGLSFGLDVDSIRKSVLEESSLSLISGSLYRAAGGESAECELSRLLLSLMETYDAWAAASMLQDQFADQLCITVLSKAEDVCTGLPPPTVDEETPGGSSSGAAPEASAAEDDPRANKIFILMDFLNMSRAEAIAIIEQHPTIQNPHEIIEAVLGA